MTISVPLEDNYEATLTQALSASGSALTIYVSRVPVATFPSGQEVVMTINPKKGFTRQENVLIESYDATAKTLTVKAAGRAQSRYAGDTATALSHAVGSKIIISDSYPVWDALNDGLAISGGTMIGQLNFSGTTHAGIKLLNLTTTQRDLLSGSNGMLIYNTTTGQLNQFIGGSWEVVSAGSTQPNASTIVAGKVEQATNAEVKAGTELGETGAPLFVNPLSTVVASSGAADDGLIPKLNGSGQLAAGFIDYTAATPAQTLSSLPAGEAIDGTTTPQLVAISDGTNGKTSGRFYKADADDTTNMLINPIGFVAVNAATPGTSYHVITNGVVGGFTGLTVGGTYYMSAIAGGITATAPTGAVCQIGIAISTTQIVLQRGLNTIYATLSGNYSNTANETVNSVITTGVRPKFIIAYLLSGVAVAVQTKTDSTSSGINHAKYLAGNLRIAQYNDYNFIAAIESGASGGVNYTSSEMANFGAATASCSLSVSSWTATTVTVTRSITWTAIPSANKPTVPFAGYLLILF